MAKKSKNKPKLHVLLKERKRWGFFGIPFTFTTYTVTDKKLIVKKGFLSVEEDEVLLFRIKDLTVRRPLRLRIFGMGCIDVVSSDASLKNFTIKNIKNAKYFQNILSEQIDNERLRLRYRPGEIIEDGDHDDYHDDYHDFDDGFMHS